MKRKLVIATTAAALLVGTGATAFATTDDAKPATQATTLDKATAAAAKSVPGTVAGAELDDGQVWEVDVYGKDAKWHEVDVNATKAEARLSDDGDRAPKATKVDINEAAAAALKTRPGTLTSIELDDDEGTGAWEAEIRGKDGREHELKVDATSAKVTPTHDDD
ncbi:PepSY domain-containing protein [Streptomyces hypolithicus]